MPVIHPAHIDETYFHNTDGTPNYGEWMVFQALRRALPDSWHILPRSRWLVARKSGVEDRGECDFLVINPDRGILDIEVKTGITWDDKHGYRQADKIVDPVGKAEWNSSQMAKMLEFRTNFLTKIGYVLCFPDNDNAYDPALGLDRLLTETDLDPAMLVNSIERAFDSWGMTSPLAQKAIDALIAEISPHMTVHREYRLEQHYIEGRIEKATSAQYGVLLHIKAQPRVAVSGCAGSGKTKLAIETARYFANMGKRVLLTCFNNNLELVLKMNETLRPHLAPDYGSKGVTVRSFNHLADHCLRIVNQQRHRQNKTPLVKDREWNDPTYARDTVVAMREMTLRFDVIVIDEGQDFHPLWVAALRQLLSNQDDGQLVFFHDPHQKLYDRGNPQEIMADHQMKEIPLFTNCRNPAPVHRAAMKYHDDGQMFGPLVEVGPEPLQMEVDRTRNAQHLQLQAWLTQNGPDASEVVVLTPHGDINPHRQWQLGSKVGDYTLSDSVETWLSPKNRNTILCTSVYQFKGLEAPFVFVTELEGISEKRRQPVLYTALSWATYQLIYFLPKGLSI